MVVFDPYLHSDRTAQWYTRLYLQKAKSDTFDSYQAFKAWLSTQFNTKVKHLRSDCGGEYLSAEFTKYLKSKGTERRVTVHDTPEHNGVAERLNWTLVERVRTMMHTSGMPKSLWGEAVMHATSSAKQPFLATDTTSSHTSVPVCTGLTDLC